MVRAAFGVGLAVLAAAVVVMSLGAGAMLGRRFNDRRAQYIAAGVAGVGLIFGFALMAFDVLAPLSIALLLAGLAALITVTVQRSQPMGDPGPAPNRRRRLRLPRAAKQPAIEVVMVDPVVRSDEMWPSEVLETRRRSPHH